MAIQKRDYMVIDADGRCVLSRIDVGVNFAVPGAHVGLGWSGGTAPFKVYAAIVGEGGYGLIGEVAPGDGREFRDTGIAPDLEIAP